LSVVSVVFVVCLPVHAESIVESHDNLTGVTENESAAMAECPVGQYPSVVRIYNSMMFRLNVVVSQ